MNTRHTTPISRKAAEQLLDGSAGPGPESRQDPRGQDPLARVLAAAAAPGRESELAGEDMAVAAFEASHLIPVATSRRGPMLKSPISRILTGKILAASLAVFATGGVALAASTGTFSGSGSVQGGASVSSTFPAVTNTGDPFSVTPTAAAPDDSASASATVSASASASASGTTSAAANLPQTATGLCQALVSDVMSAANGAGVQANGSASASASASASPALTVAVEEQALSSGLVLQVLNGSEFASLTATTQSSSTVPDYCALLLNLPQLPQPGDLSKLPASVLSAVPTSALSQVLPTLPSSTLSSVLTTLPTSNLSSVLTELPTSGLSSVLTNASSSATNQVLTQVSPSTAGTLLSELPSSTLGNVLSELSPSALSQVLTELPKSTVSQLLSELPTSLVSQLLNQLPNSIVSGLLSGLSSSLVGQLNLNLTL